MGGSGVRVGRSWAMIDMCSLGNGELGIPWNGCAHDGEVISGTGEMCAIYLSDGYDVMGMCGGLFTKEMINIYGG